MDSKITNAVEREIVELHEFFERWFTGLTGEDVEETFRRFHDVLAPEFAIISPSGRLSPRDKLVEDLRRACGANREEKFAIEVRNVQVRFVEGSVACATYEEWQTRNDRTRGRLSTVIFRRREGMPNGLEWLHVHETWLDGK